MTERERFIKTLRREPVPGRVPTFELEFFLTMEAFGRVHPGQRAYHQWNQMSPKERHLHLDDQADLSVKVMQTYNHSAMLLHVNPGDFDSVVRIMELIREKSGGEFAIMSHGDPTFSIPDGNEMMAFTERLYEDGEGLHKEAKQHMADSIAFAEKMAAHHPGLLDGFCLCSDYCFNTNPFFSREMFAEFIAPYLKETIAAYHDLGFFAIKHTDGNIMPIIDMLVESGADALHSLDPQGGVDLAGVSRDWGDKIAMCGNVNCALLQTGTQEECEADIRRSLRDGMARGAGYVFCTSNCAYTGLPLERYELMNQIWMNEGVYT